MNLEQIWDISEKTFFIQQKMDGAVFKKDQQGWVNHLVLTKKI